MTRPKAQWPCPCLAGQEGSPEASGLCPCWEVRVVCPGVITLCFGLAALGWPLSWLSKPIVGERDLPPQICLWREDYFRPITFKRQKTQEGLFTSPLIA